MTFTFTVNFKYVDEKDVVYDNTSYFETETYKKPSWAITATQQLTLSGDSARSLEPEKKRPISSSPAIQKTIFGGKPIAPALSSDEIVPEITV